MSGAGAYEFGGRWNSSGNHVVYASGNLSLAMLELLVHVQDAAAFRKVPLVYHTISFASEALAVLQSESLPAGWNSQPEARSNHLVGDEWLDQAESVALAVPSVMIPRRFRYAPEYMNYLINPNHPDFAGAVEVGEVLDLALDARLLE